jgi:hypothetical protein
MTPERADAIAAALELDVAETPICYACLSFVSFPLDSGDTAQARREARRVAPDIWDEGLAEPALDALRKAVAEGVLDADHALRDADAARGRSAVARAIVFRLAAQMVERTGSPFGPDTTAGWAGAAWSRV